MNKFDKKIIQKTKDAIKLQFGLSSEESLELAIKALHGLDSHGVDCSDWLTVKRVIDVVVKSWIENQ